MEWWKKLRRNSEDETINGVERSLLEWCRMFGVGILNSDCRGGEIEKYIYVSKSKTTIDYGIENIDAWSNTEEFSIKDWNVLRSYATGNKT